METSEFYKEPVYWMLLIPVTMLIPYFINRMKDKMINRAWEASDTRDLKRFLFLTGEIAKYYRKLKGLPLSFIKRVRNPFILGYSNEDSQYLDCGACYDYWQKNVFEPMERDYMFGSFGRGKITSTFIFLIYI